MQHNSFDELDTAARPIHHSSAPTYDDSMVDVNHQENQSKSHPDILLSLQEQMQSISDRLERIEQLTSSHTFINKDSHSTPTRLFRTENYDGLLTEYYQAEEEIKRLKCELAIARSQIHNNQSTVFSSYPVSPMLTELPSNYKLSQSASASADQSQYHGTPQSRYANSVPSATAPNQHIPLLTPTNIPTSNPTPFTMNINNLPSFTGAIHERPVQFLNKFEIRATTLVGQNDYLLLQTVQQVLSDGALNWFSQLQSSSERAHDWTEFKERFYERYRTPAKIQHFRTELRLLFQDDNESTLDYFERLKALMVEIDPSCNEQWLKNKFIQKLRPDIRTRLDIDDNLSIRDIVRKAQAIETNIAQQKVDEKIRIAAFQETKTTTVAPLNRPITDQYQYDQHHPNVNNTFVGDNGGFPMHMSNDIIEARDNVQYFKRQSPTIDQRDNYENNHYRNYNYYNNTCCNSNTRRANSNYNLADCGYHNSDLRRNDDNSNTKYLNNHNDNNNNNNNSRYFSHSFSNKYNSTKSENPLNKKSNHEPNQHVHAATKTVNSSMKSKNRWWCPSCQRHGHSWERCPSNPESINYRRTSTSRDAPSPRTLTSATFNSSSPTGHNNTRSENVAGR